MRKAKITILFVFVSFIIHMYIMLILGTGLDSELQKLAQLKESFKNNNIDIDYTIVETQTESKKQPESGMISDKANLNSGIKSDLNSYNYINPSLKPLANSIQNDNKKFPDDKEQKQSDPKNGDFQDQSDQSEKSSKNNDSGDYHTSFVDPNKDLRVTMNSEGDLSLATIPLEFAPYFLEMQKKIKQNWGNFFPVFQYYQGIIKSGEVIIGYSIDKDGNISDARIEKSYGYNIIDQSSLNAIIYCRNFGPLPEELSKLGKIPVFFKFIYLSK